MENDDFFDRKQESFLTKCRKQVIGQGILVLGIVLPWIINAGHLMNYHEWWDFDDNSHKRLGKWKFICGILNMIIYPILLNGIVFRNDENKSRFIKAVMVPIMILHFFYAFWGVFSYISSHMAETFHMMTGVKSNQLITFWSIFVFMVYQYMTEKASMILKKKA